ncbi:MAG: TonB-dependent receptor plug domain-containing protein [Nibricoccus sp.]
MAALTGVAGIVLAGPLASAADSDEKPTGSPEFGMDTVVVEADRLDLDRDTASGALGTKSLLDTPFSVTVVDASEISRRQATTVAEVFLNDPSVFSYSAPATTNWWGAQIRGLGVRNYYIDGVALELSWGGEFPLEAVESVEALKGLTGFMYGFGSPGGLLKYETKKPTDETMFDVGLTYHNDSAFTGQIDAGGRVGQEGRFGYRVNVATDTGEAYNTAGLNRHLGSVSLDYRISDNLRWHGSAVYEDNRLEHEPFYFYWDLYEGDRLPTPTYDYKNVTVRNSWYDSETRLATTGLEWQVNENWNADVTVGFSRKLHRSNKMFGDLLNEDGDYAGSAYNFAGLLKNEFLNALVQGRVTTGAISHDLVFGTSLQRTRNQWSNEWYWSNDFDGNIYEPQTFLITRDIDFSLAPLGRRHAAERVVRQRYAALRRTLAGHRRRALHRLRLEGSRRRSRSRLRL